MYLQTKETAPAYGPRTPFLNYRRIHFAWMNAELRLLRRKGIFTEEEVRAIKDTYKNGFHVHFQPIVGTNFKASV